MKAAIYARYSSDNQREESIEAQIRAIQEYSQRNQIHIVKIYTDEAKSATTDNRPQFLRMVNDSKLGLFEAAIVHKLDRFARNRYDSAHYKKMLKDNGVKLISVLENLDDSPESIILESMLQGMAEYYSANLSREVMKGMRETAYKGKHNGGIPPLGYGINLDKTYHIIENEAKTVSIIFERFLLGQGYQSIANELNGSGKTTKQGKQFKKNTIRDILLNEKYTGTYVFNRRADGKTLNKIKPDEEIIRVENALPAIITKEQFEKTQNRINGQKTGRRIRVMHYLLTGKLFCGECNKHYTGAGHVKGRDRSDDNPTKYYRYACTGKKGGCQNKPVRKETIEDAVINEIKDKILNDEKIPMWVEQLLEKIKESKSENTNRISEIGKEITKLKNQIDKDFQLYYDDLMDKTILAEKVNTKKEKISLLENELIILNTRNYAPNKDMIIAYLHTMKNNLESGDVNRQQKVIDTLVQCVVVYPDRIDIDIGIDDSGDSDKGTGGEPLLTLSLSILRP